jgi:hypothetical protein
MRPLPIISVQYVVDRLRQPRSRADELVRLRRRLTAAGVAARDATPRERAVAGELRALRAELHRAQQGLSSCGSCASGCVAPAGRWDGGFCCSGETANIFDDDEVAALALGGTTARDLVPPRDDHAGCAFRGATGCTLAPVDRPNLCLIYLCRDARREAHQRRALDEVQRLTSLVVARLQELARARLDRELATPIGRD